MKVINKKRGFTLIELLVVIAIIGILSSVVLVSLGVARSKAKDAKVEQQLASLRSSSEIYYTANSNAYQTSGSAITACDAALSFFVDTASGKPLLDAVSNDLNGVVGTYTDMTCGINADGSAWSVSAKLPSNPSVNPYACVDSTGFSGTQAAAPTTAQYCDGTAM